MKTAIQSVKRGLRWAWGYKLRTVALLLVLTLAVPKPVRSQFLDPCCAIMAAGLSTISSTLSNVIGGGLNGILSIEQGISTFEQTVVWPQNLINQAPKPGRNIRLCTVWCRMRLRRLNRCGM